MSVELRWVFPDETPEEREQREYWSRVMREAAIKALKRERRIRNARWN